MTPQLPPWNLITADESRGCSTLFGLLSDHRCRLALEILSDEADTIDIDLVASEIACRIGQPTAELIETIRIDLHHHQLPKLDDAEVIHYDSIAGTVRADPAITELRPYLELARDEGFDRKRSDDTAVR